MSGLAKIFLVTGASSGIGRAIAEKLLALDYQVIGVSRDITKFRRGHPGFVACQLDLNQSGQLSRQIAELLKQFPRLNGAIFAAGIGQFGSLEEFSHAQIEQLMRVNFTSNALITRSILPALKRNGRADLVYIGSEAALKGSRKGAMYCASKFALRGFTQSLREECAKTGLRVALINPGMVRTPFFNDLNFEPGDAAGQFIDPVDVAEAVLYVLNTNHNIIVDEINLSPLNKVVNFKK